MLQHVEQKNTAKNRIALRKSHSDRRTAIKKNTPETIAAEKPHSITKSAEYTLIIKRSLRKTPICLKTTARSIFAPIQNAWRIMATRTIAQNSPNAT
jgi:hypothetical protein